MVESMAILFIRASEMIYAEWQTPAFSPQPDPSSRTQIRGDCSSLGGKKRAKICGNTAMKDSTGDFDQSFKCLIY